MACISSAYALLHDCPEGNRKLYRSIDAELNLPVELSKVMDSDISDGAKNLILGGNIARIIGLRQGEL